MSGRRSLEIAQPVGVAQGQGEGVRRVFRQGVGIQVQQHCDHFLHLFFVGPAGSHDGFFDLGGGVFLSLIHI